MFIKIGKYKIEGVHGDYTVAGFETAKDGAHKGELVQASKHYYPKLRQALLFVRGRAISEADKCGINKLIEVIKKQTAIIIDALDKQGVK